MKKHPFNKSPQDQFTCTCGQSQFDAVHTQPNTIATRFDKIFKDYGTPVIETSREGVLAFFQAELLALAEQVEGIGLGVSKSENNHGTYYGGLEDSATLIRNRANEIV